MINKDVLLGLIKGSNLPKTKICKLAGVPRPSYEGILESRDCKISTLDKLARLFGVPTGSLLEDYSGQSAIITSGPYSPGVMKSSVIYASAQDALKVENEMLRNQLEMAKEQLAMAKELLKMYRQTSGGDVRNEDGKV